ncbi:MAG: hypothetical protein ACREPQ_09780 [Rhodanobacter sp.]
MEVTFITTQVGRDFRGEVIDIKTHKSLLRTGIYASAETAKSAAVSQWRAKQAQEQRECAA